MIVDIVFCLTYLDLLAKMPI